MTKTGYLLVSFIAAFYVASLVYFVTKSTATLVFTLFILFFGIIFSAVITNKQQRLSALKVFNIIYCAYVLLALIHFLGFESDWSYFTQDWRDEYKFYSLTEANQYQNISEIFQDTFINNVYLEYGLYVFYISSLASLAHTYFDGNHLLLQFLGTTLFSILTAVIVFKIFWIYVSDRKAYIYSLVFMLFSVLSTYSYYLLRDSAIAFFFISGIYLTLAPPSKYKFSNLLLLVLINWLIWQLRFETGMVFSLLTLFYYFKAYGKNKIGALFGFVGAIGVIAFSITYFNKAFESLSKYSEFSEAQNAEKQDSLGAIIYQLPPGIKQIFTIINSQIQPFPAWNGLELSNLYFLVQGLLEIVSTLFWFIVFISLSKWLAIDRRKLNLKDPNIKFLSLVCALFFIASTANMAQRRLMVFYPFIFLIYILMRTYSVSKVESRKTLIQSVFLYLLLVILYYILKL